jgi:hypothetical protein
MMPPKMLRVRILGAAMAATTILLLLLLAETTVRWLDGYPLITLALPALPATVSPIHLEIRHDPAERYLSKVILSRGIDQQWYKHDPPPRPRTPMTLEIAKRFDRYQSTDPYGAFFAWNHVYLRQQLCAGASFGSLGVLDDFYVFEPPTQTPYPTYRHLSNISPPTWFPTNRFGWRGPDVTLHKPKDTIRIAFAGSSSTIDPYYLPFSHIEYIGEWLSLWARARGYPYRIEVINAARTGIDAPSVAGIVLQELLPLEPDLVIYDGSNDFKPGMLLKLPPQGLPPPPLAVAPVASVARWRAERYSAFMRRVRIISRRVRQANAAEPSKPSYPIDWPRNVDEFHPRITQTLMPMGLNDVISQFDAMRTSVLASGGEFAIASAVVMVRDGLKLDLSRDLTLYNFLNSWFYPLTYAQTRRLVDFKNRVFQAYCERYKLPFFDIAAVSPLDPELFGDGVHMTPAGLRLEAWTYLQLISAWLEKEIESGHLPRTMQHPPDVHPGFVSVDYPRISRARILETCH